MIYFIVDIFNQVFHKKKTLLHLYNTDKISWPSTYRNSKHQGVFGGIGETRRLFEGTLEAGWIVIDVKYFQHQINGI